MRAKPVEAIERMREWSKWNNEDLNAVLAYIDSIPDGSVPVVWPAELTLERLEELSNRFGPDGVTRDALRALAAIAPGRKKRVVNLWRAMGTALYERPTGWMPESHMNHDGWKCVARNVELED